jgi:branched-chain amino acid transport system permease protein
VYLGGMGSLSGSALAAVLFTFLMQLLTPLLILKWVFIPLLLILLMQFRPEGLMGNRELPEVSAGILEKIRKKWPWKIPVKKSETKAEG